MLRSVAAVSDHRGACFSVAAVSDRRAENWTIVAGTTVGDRRSSGHDGRKGAARVQKIVAGTTVGDRRSRFQPGFLGGVNLIFFTSSTTVPSGCGMPETAVIALTTLMYFSP